MHPKDNEVYPKGSIVRLKKTGEFARIERVVFRMNDNTQFSHYEGPIEGRGEGNYALFHAEIELEALPNKDQD